MEMNFLEWLGYIASFIVLISLTMSSILKLRWINLTGSILFAIYGFKIGSIPTGFMNVGIAFINIYYLFKIYNTKESLKLVKADRESDYLKHLYEVNKKDIDTFMTNTNFNNSDEFYYMLRDNNTAGILAGRSIDEGKTFFIDLDYVTPKYRDFKLGDYFFNKNTIFLREKGYTRLQSSAANEMHSKYLLKIGFKTVDNKLFEKKI